MFKNLNPSALGVSGHQSELIELALTYGFAGMDLNVAEFATRVRLKGMSYARRLIDSAKIRIGTFSLPLEWETDDETFQKELKKLSEYADYAAELGCTRSTAVLPPAGDVRPYHENFEFHRHRFYDICAALKPAGIRLAIGFQAAEYLRRNRAFQFIHDLDALTLLLNMVAAPNLGLLLDTWDIVACGGSVELDPQASYAPDRRRAGGRHAGRRADCRVGREVPPRARRRQWADRRGGVPGRVADGGLRRTGHAQAVARRFQSRRRDVIIKQTSEALDKVLRPSAPPTAARPVLAAVN